jgi:transposase
MAYSYKPVDRDQLFLLPPDVREWLPKGHLAWFVLDVVERLDTSALHARHPKDGVGRQAYDPDMLLALLIYAYCTGVRSSRAVERLCEVDVAFKVVAANHVPDHSTIARFRQAYDLVAQQLFVGALSLCAKAGLGKLGVVAIDGTKLAANASLKANRTRGQVEAEVAKMFSEAKAKDAEEDRLFGEGRGDELPEGFSDPSKRAARLDQALRQLEAEGTARRAEEDAARARAEEVARLKGPGRPMAEQSVARAEAELKRLSDELEAPPDGHLARAEAAWAKLGEALEAQVASAEAALAGALEEARSGEAAKVNPSGNKKGRPPKCPGGLKMAKAQTKHDRAVALAERRRRHGLARLEKARQRARSWAQYRLGKAQAKLEGARQHLRARDERLAAKSQEPRANVTDPDSRIMSSKKGWVQGYNAQAAVSQDGIILAAPLTQDHCDFAQFQPVLVSVLENLASAGVEGAIGVVLADAGYLSEENLAAPGPDRLIATAKSWKMRREAKEKGYATGSPPEGASPVEAMEHRLRTEEGSRLYGLRQHTVEPVFGDAKYNRGFTHFMRRGKKAAGAEWALEASVHNLLKLFRHVTYSPAAT